MMTHNAYFTRVGDTPSYAGLIHRDGAVSEIRVETNEHDELVVTVIVAAGKRWILQRPGSADGMFWRFPESGP